MTPRELFDMSRNSRPPFVYRIMSSGRFRLPSSAIVVPTTFEPVRLSSGKRTSGVHV